MWVNITYLGLTALNISFLLLLLILFSVYIFHCFLVKLALLELNSSRLTQTHTHTHTLQVPPDRRISKFTKCEKANVFPHYLCMQAAGCRLLESAFISNHTQVFKLKHKQQYLLCVCSFITRLHFICLNIVLVTSAGSVCVWYFNHSWSNLFSFSPVLSPFGDSVLWIVSFNCAVTLHHLPSLTLDNRKL